MKGEPISISGIEKRYGSFKAVDGVSLGVAAGEFLSILGPSGSGKTTLLMMLAGFESPSAGAIKVGPRDITRLVPNERGIGMVFQKYALFPHMSVAQNIAFPLRMRKAPKSSIQGRVEEALAMVRLEGFGARMPSQLSGGQQQRVAVARALVFEPPVLLMDEPLGALDKKLREQLQIEIKRLQKKLGVTVVYVTHDQEEALTMSDRIAVMNGGRVEQIGTPTELYTRPINGFVADFVGKTNFMHGTVRAVGDGLVTVALKHGATIEVATTSASGAALRTGDAVHVAVRPEALRLVRPGHYPANGTVNGAIETIIFVGSFIELLVRVDVATLISVHVPLADVGSLSEGEAVRLHWDPAAINVYPAGTQ